MEAPGSSAAGTETGMTVYLSYSHEDAAWKDRLLRELMPLLQRDPPTSAVYVWSDDQLAPGSRWEAEIDRVRKRASAAILLISTNYLESGYTAAQEIAQLVHLQSETGLRLLPVLVEPSEWNAIPWLRELQLLPRGAVPLSTLDPEQQEVALAQVARELHDVIARIAAQNTSSSPVIESDTDTAAPLDEADLFRSLSPSARNALEHAEGLRQATDGDGVHMEHLIAGLNQKDHGPAQRLFAAAGIEPDELRRIIETAVETDIPVIDGVYTVARLSALPPHSKHVREALIAARDVAGARGFPIVRSRHLLYGALSVEECSVIRPLLERGVRKEDILLEDTPPAAVGAAIAGFRSDEARGEDLLDITREVETLCSVLAARDVEPPVSLGLFGEWGSGKSFFMSKMEECIREITAAAQTAGNGGAAYCSNIIQIKFNAWHYIDTNLWASLASEIFEGLARAIADDKTVAVEGMDRDEARARLLAIAADSRNVLADAERRRELAETELYESEQRLERLERSEAEIQRSLGAGAILHEAYRFAVRQPEVSGKVDEAAKALNLPAAKAAATEARAQLLELHGFWGYLRGLWLAMRNQKHLPIWLLSALLFAGVVAGFTLLLTRVDPSGAARLITWGAAVVAAASAFVAPFIPPVRRAIQLVRDARESNSRLINDQRRKKQTELEAEQEKLRQQLVQTHQQVEAAREEVQSIERRIDELRADRQMADFIRERRNSADYTQHLGVIARARNDFQRLSTLLAQVREQRQEEQQKFPAGDGEGEAHVAGSSEDEARHGGKPRLRLPVIDRIILYIDDLDRCPEDKVIDVLQAVHLLLAFPLFVVVVGVDSRWLLHSLRQHSKAFQHKLAEMSEMPEEERVHWQSTPLNYLEKIFQIPFNLRPMQIDGFGKLIDSLAASQPVSKPVPHGGQAFRGHDLQSGRSTPSGDDGTRGSKSHETQTSPIGQGADVSARTTVELGGQQPSMPPENVTALSRDDRSPTVPLRTRTQIDLNPDHLRIEEWERDYMKQLHRLMPSPRAAKRFVNVYRLIRAKKDALGEYRAFVGDRFQGGYRSVLLLLAIQIGYPMEGTEILRDLLERKSAIRWWDFIDTYRAHLQPSQAEPDGAAREPTEGYGGRSDNRKVTPDTNSFEGARWQQLLDTLDMLRHLIPAEQSCEEFKDAARDVARYSFVSGRVLHGQPSETAAG